MTKTTSDERYRAPALDKGLDILELLANQPKGLTRAEIVKATGRSASEIYRMIERLVVRNYLFRSIEGDRFSLTMKLYELGCQHPPQRRLATLAQPLLDQFADVIQQSIHLAAPDRGNAYVIAQASPRARWEFRLRLGATIDLSTTGSGQTLLAFQSNDRLREILFYGAENKKAVTDELSALQGEFEKIRVAGHRIGASKQLLGVTDISAPVLSIDGSAIAVLTCPYVERLDDPEGHENSLNSALEHLKQVTARLSLN